MVVGYGEERFARMTANRNRNAVVIPVIHVCDLPLQTRCLTSPGWATWRSTPGRTPPSSASLREKFPRRSRSCWR